ncbi:Aste57867_10362 [Aphanomyces stellatus]|uniref:Aste57867_10362 protein n=1 Tax=Aphanomyces stellatus TaxID=120398 RepID=A0A485KQN7_9STRA|nr:hypothetical protein As57867_010322 [Aphanomyces stellatus]VFT87236.1 Aste57867_10362 [Aphanomyces stellatus]
MTTTVTPARAIPASTEWKFPPPMTLPWKTLDRMPSKTQQHPVFTFGTVTTFVFPLAYGGSAIPRDQGPPLGLAKTHVREECQPLATMSYNSSPSRVEKFDHVERMMLLQKAGYSRKDVAEMCFDAIAVRQSREDSRREEVSPVPLDQLRMAKRPRTEFKIGRK